MTFSRCVQTFFLDSNFAFEDRVNTKQPILQVFVDSLEHLLIYLFIFLLPNIYVDYIPDSHVAEQDHRTEVLHF